MPFVRRPDGARLYFERHGKPDAESLILLEGLGGDIPGWRRNIPHLAAELAVIAFDFRGNGRSEAPDVGWTMTTFIDDTIAVLDSVDADRSHVYGQSFGGMVAQELALVHPDRVRTLILACTHAGGPHVVPSDPRAPKDRPWLALYSEAFAAAHPEHVDEDLRVGRAQHQHPQGQRRQREIVRSFDAYDRLPRITAPTLVLHGSEDRLIAPANAEVLASRIPGAELLWLEGAGHLYHSEQADAADAAVLAFVRRHSQ